MTKQTGVLPMEHQHEQPLAGTAYAEGIRAGLVGAVTIAIWFAILDGLRGRLFFTPTVLGTALFRGGAGLDDPASLAPSFEMVVSFTWVHMLVFLLFGMAAALLLERAERDSDVGFGILLLVFIFEAGFMGACMIFAEPVLQALTWPAIAVGNVLAACAMGAVFWRAHRSLTVQP